MNPNTRYLTILFTLPLLAFSVSNISADETNCTKDDVIGQWTSYSIDLSVSDHIEYHEKIDIVYLQTLDTVDQFSVSFSGIFSAVVNPWVGQCVGDEYVLRGEISSHDNVHSIQAVRNSAAPTTDQCSLERCESTCVVDLFDECSVSKTVSDRKLTFMLLPGHKSTGDAEEHYLASESGCFSHDCNHPGLLHTHD